MNRLAPALWLLPLLSLTALAQAPKPPLAPLPTDAECQSLASPQRPFAFGPGETLDFDLDAMGAQAGKMSMKVLPLKDGQLPVEVHAQTNTFFSKVRRVNGTATSYLNPKTLRPTRYVEDATENEISRFADVQFAQKEKRAQLQYRINKRTGAQTFNVAGDAFDTAGAIYLLRQLPLKVGMKVCFDAYGIRKMWRVWGEVVEREHASTHLGEFEAFHISGTAARLDNPVMRREIHVWISDDKKRLPLAALGAIDLGAVRATLVGYSQKGETKRAEGSDSLKW